MARRKNARDKRVVRAAPQNSALLRGVERLNRCSVKATMRLASVCLLRCAWSFCVPSKTHSRVSLGTAGSTAPAHAINREHTHYLAVSAAADLPRIVSHTLDAPATPRKRESNGSHLSRRALSQRARRGCETAEPRGANWRDSAVACVVRLPRALARTAHKRGAKAQWRCIFVVERQEAALDALKMDAHMSYALNVRVSLAVVAVVCVMWWWCVYV